MCVHRKHITKVSVITWGDVILICISEGKFVSCLSDEHSQAHIHICYTVSQMGQT